MTCSTEILVCLGLRNMCTGCVGLHNVGTGFQARPVFLRDLRPFANFARNKPVPKTAIIFADKTPPSVPNGPKLTIMHLADELMRKLAILILSLATMPSLAQDAATCPLEIDSLKLSHSVFGVGTVASHSQPTGKLSFTYKNVSGKDIQSITLRAEGSKQVSGPTGPSFLKTSRTVFVNGPMPANTSKKLSVKLPEGNLYTFELEQVKFSNGDTWTNDGKTGCVANAKGAPRQ